MNIAKGSASESRLWAEYAGRFGYISTERVNNWLEHYDEIGKMLFGLKTGWKKTADKL